MRTFIFSMLLFAFFNIFSQSTLKGIITDKETGQPIPGAAIYIHELQKGVISNPEGTFLITNIPQGNFQVHFS